MENLRPVIYVANPYTGTSYERNQRFLAVEKYTAHLIRNGKTAISPIVHNHVLAFRHELPHDFGFWQNYCLSLLFACDEMHVLMLDGWEESVGVEGEIEEASEREKTIWCIDPEDYEKKSHYVLPEYRTLKHSAEKDREIYGEMDGSEDAKATTEELY